VLSPFFGNGSGVLLKERDCISLTLNTTNYKLLLDLLCIKLASATSRDIRSQINITLAPKG
jgi:hypothetical protein